MGEFLKTLPLPSNHRLNGIPGSHIKIAHSTHNTCILHSVFPYDHVKAGERGDLIEGKWKETDVVLITAVNASPKCFAKTYEHDSYQGHGRTLSECL